MKILTAIIVFHVLVPHLPAQSISSSLPHKINPSERYMFYLHGGVVTVLGNNAINQSVPEWGPYEYLNILDSLRKQGFYIISENRKEGVSDSLYAIKLSKQVDSLLSAHVPTSNIILLGASSGWDIVLKAADRLKNKNLNYVIMGGCWAETYKDYQSLQLNGHFLSIIEESDPHGTCYKILEGRKEVSSYREVKLNTGLSHGFFYKGRKVWIDPLIKWFAERR